MLVSGRETANAALTAADRTPHTGRRAWRNGLLCLSGSSPDDFREFDLEAINGYVAQGQTDRIHRYFRTLERYLASGTKTYEQIMGLCVNLYLNLRYSSARTYHEFNAICRDSEGFINEIYSRETLAEVIACMRREFLEISSGLSDGNGSGVVRRLTEYIDRNFGKDLKLEHLGEAFGYNSAYLGKLFSRTMKESFNAYLDRVRIEEAKRLLLTGCFRVYEVAQMVGYKNVDYFYSKFRAGVGCSPKAFTQRKDPD